MNETATDTTTAPSTRLVVTSGNPTDEDIAAIVIALTPVAVERSPTGPSPWQRAAMLESRGIALVSSPHDLHRVR